MATLSDIAALVGVNKTTVSKALRGSSDISRETRQRVQTAAAQLGYAAAPRKVSAPARLVGVLCPEVTSYYYSRIVTALNEFLMEQSFATVLMLTDFSHRREEELIDQLAKLDVAGAICITEHPNIGDILAAQTRGRAMPTVVMGLNYEALDHDAVSVNERLGIRQAVERLILLKHRRIAFIGDELENERLRYLREALSAKGLSLPDEYISISPKRFEARGYEGMKALLKLAVPPTAVVAGYDAVALGAYRAICEAGLSVPGDLSLVGFDDADFCGFLPISLTSINSNAADMCRIVTKILLKKIREPEYRIVQTVAVQPEFIARESIGPARNA